MKPVRFEPRVKGLLALLWLVLANGFVFWQVLGFDFVALDDLQYVVENRRVEEGLSLENVGWAFTTGYEGTWQPLVWISFLVDRELFGTGPGGFHGTNLFLHGLNALLVYGFARSAGAGRGVSVLVASLFSLHPLRVESVAWVTERKDVLSGFFGLLALIFYLRARGLRRLFLCGLFLALGLMAKPVLVTWPVVFLLLDRFPLHRTAGAKPRSIGFLILEKIPFFLIVAGSAVVTLVVQAREGALPPGDRLALATRVVNAVHSYAWYLVKTVWPSGLCVFYPHPGLPGVEDLTGLEVVASGALLLAVTVVFLRWGRGWLLWGWLFFLVTLFPMIGIVQTGSHARADRFTYLPSVGLLLGLCAGLLEGVGRLERRGPALERVVAGAGVVLVLAAMAATRTQTATWKDSVTLFEHARATADDSPTLRTWLGQSLESEGRLDEALVHYRKAVTLNPHLPRAHRLLGTALRARGRLDDALLHLRQAVKLDPDSALAQNDYGIALYSLGDRAGAARCFREALALRRGFAEASNNLGVVLRDEGELAEAAACFERALEARPGFTRARENLAEVRARMRSGGVSDPPD